MNAASYTTASESRWKLNLCMVVATWSRDHFWRLATRTTLKCKNLTVTSRVANSKNGVVLEKHMYGYPPGHGSSWIVRILVLYFMHESSKTNTLLFSLNGESTYPSS